MSFKGYIEEKSSTNYYVHMTYLKGTPNTKEKTIEKKLTDTFYKLQFESAPDEVSIVNSYNEKEGNSIFYTMVFEVNNAGNIMKTPRATDVIIQTSNKKHK